MLSWQPEAGPRLLYDKLCREDILEHGCAPCHAAFTPPIVARGRRLRKLAETRAGEAK